MPDPATEPLFPTNADEAESMGWIVDNTTYPWTAYVGARFMPDGVVWIDTPAYEVQK